MNIAKAHGLLGHGDEESTQQSAKELGWAMRPRSVLHEPCYNPHALPQYHLKENKCLRQPKANTLMSQPKASTVKLQPKPRGQKNERLSSDFICAFASLLRGSVRPSVTLE